MNTSQIKTLPTPEVHVGVGFGYSDEYYILPNYIEVYDQILVYGRKKKVDYKVPYGIEPIISKMVQGYINSKRDQNCPKLLSAMARFKPLRHMTMMVHVIDSVDKTLIDSNIHIDVRRRSEQLSIFDELGMFSKTGKHSVSRQIHVKFDYITYTMKMFSRSDMIACKNVGTTIKTLAVNDNSLPRSLMKDDTVLDYQIPYHEETSLLSFKKVLEDLKDDNAYFAGLYEYIATHIANIRR